MATVLVAAERRGDARIAVPVVETHDRIVGETWRKAKSYHDARTDDAKAALKYTMRAFSTLGSALLDAHEELASLDEAVQTARGWSSLLGLVATAAQLTHTLAADPPTRVVHGYHRFRRYAPRMLLSLDIQAAPAVEPLLVAAMIILDRETKEVRLLTYLRPGWLACRLENRASRSPSPWPTNSPGSSGPA